MDIAHLALNWLGFDQSEASRWYQLKRPRLQRFYQVTFVFYWGPDGSHVAADGPELGYPGIGVGAGS